MFALILSFFSSYLSNHLAGTTKFTIVHIWLEVKLNEANEVRDLAKKILGKQLNALNF